MTQTAVALYKSLFRGLLGLEDNRANYFIYEILIMTLSLQTQMVRVDLDKSRYQCRGEVACPIYPESRIMHFLFYYYTSG